MTQAKENLIHSLQNCLKFDLFSLEFVFLSRNKNTYLKGAISMHWPLSKEAPDVGAHVQAPGWMDAQGTGPDAGQGKSGLWASGSQGPGPFRLCDHLYSPQQHTT